MNNISQSRGNQTRKTIYVIRNRINSKVYVGQTKDITTRFLQHCKPSSANDNSLIAKAIQEYGANNFWVEILEKDVLDYNERESYWIKTLNSLEPNGYNIQPGGDAPPHYKGLKHPFSCFESEDDINGIKECLKNSALSLGDIAKRFNVSKKTILRINQGIVYESASETYPLRKIPLRNGKLTKENVLEIIETLKYTYRQYKDIAKQFGVNENTIKLINSGDVHNIPNENYPIRKYKNSGAPACTYEQVTQISELLLRTSISCRQIAKQFGVDLQTVYIINNGNAKRYRRKEFTYPIRKHNPKS